MKHKAKKIHIGKERRRHARLKQDKRQRHAINQERRARKRADQVKVKLAKEQHAAEQRLMQSPAVKRAIEERQAKEV